MKKASKLSKAQENAGDQVTIGLVTCIWLVEGVTSFFFWDQLLSKAKPKYFSLQLWVTGVIKLL